MYPPPATVPSIVSAEKGGAYLTGLLRVRVSRSGLVWWFATYRIFDACFTYGNSQDTEVPRQVLYMHRYVYVTRTYTADS